MSMVEVRHRASEALQNLRCTKPRSTSPGYGYLIQLVAAQLRGSKKRNAASLSGDDGKLGVLEAVWFAHW